MPTVKIQLQGQITLPDDILQAWHLPLNEEINVSLVDGVVTLTPVNHLKRKQSIMAYAGIARGLWGDTADDIDNFIRHERDSWEK
jgi:hypothetical protein